MKITVCVGSACHRKNSYEIIDVIREEMEKNALKDVELKAGFCFGNCDKEGVTVMVCGQVYTGYTVENAKERFYSEIIPRLKIGDLE